MPSHLSRLVIRRLLSNKPIISRACVFRSTGCKLIQSSYVNHHYNGSIQRRTFFGWGRGPKQRQLKQPHTAPGLQKLLELKKMMMLKSHPPAPSELVEALEALLGHKNETRTPLQDHEVEAVRTTIEHLQQLTPKEDGEPWISSKILRSTLDALQWVPNDRQPVHLALAKYALEALEKAGEPDISAQEIVWLLMTLFGEISQARDWLVRSKKSGVPIHKFELSWIAILNAYARESNKQEVVRTIKIINEMEPWDERLTNGVISAFATLRDAHHVKYYYEEAVSKGISITPQTTSLVVKHCVRVLDHKWMYNIVRTLVAKTELSRIDWETIFLWALAIRRGVDEVARMMRVLVARTKDHGRPVELNINTINMLIDVCHSWHDSYTAERFVTLGRIRRIIPNATTYILQMRYRLSVGDIDGAIIAYKRFRPQNTDEIKDNEDGPTVNRLLENMITSGKYSTDSILSIVDDLTERQVRFEPDTVAAMSGFHLQRDELHDAIDLLMTHTCNYSLGERTKVADTLITICVDTHKSPSLAWDTYSILAAIFPDTPRSKREDVMEAFFKRQKAEMAVHVFSDFRRHDNPDIRANNESYVKAFVGISDVGDVDSLDVVHNTMKVDVNVNLDTRLLNALMLAHIGCDMPQRALVYWDQIFKSPEGPNYNSIMIAFRACEKAPFGFEKAQPLWNRLRRLDIEISREMFASYVGALAGNAMVDEAIELVESGRRDFGFEPDVLTLGAMFNATAGYVKQEQVEKYIRRSYYNVWAELEKIGIHENSWRMKYVKMNRRLSP